MERTTVRVFITSASNRSALAAAAMSTSNLGEYHVVGRKTPTDTDPAPQIYRMRVFAKNEVQATSRFW